MTSHAAVILAAGASTRYRSAGGRASSKLLATLDGTPLIRIVASAALQAGVNPVIAVLGYEAEAVADAIAGLPVTTVKNRHHGSGLASSLRAGLESVPPSCAGALILLGDMPLVTRAMIDGLIGHARAHPHADAVVPTVQGRRGNPVLLSRRLFAAACGLTGDAGARHLLRDPSVHVEEVPQGDRGTIVDIDLPEHLDGLGEGSSVRRESR